MDDAPGCRGCGSTSLVLVQRHTDAAAVTPGGNTLSIHPPPPEQLGLCRHCALVQTIGTGPSVYGFAAFEAGPRPELSPWQARQLASQVIATQKLRPTSLAVEIGSRDGALLKHYQAAGIPVLGIEPAVRLAERARLEHGVPTLCRHFGRHLAAHLEGCGQPAEVMHVHFVLSGLVDLDGFLAGLPIAMRPSGIIVLEVSYVRDLVNRGELMSPPYRQWSYFSLTSLVRLLGRHALVVHDAEQNDEAGGSLRLFVGKEGDCSARVARLLADEADWGVERAETYQKRGSATPRQRARVA